jgi:hypothetical protein
MGGSRRSGNAKLTAADNARVKAYFTSIPTEEKQHAREKCSACGYTQNTNFSRATIHVATCSAIKAASSKGTLEAREVKEFRDRVLLALDGTSTLTKTAKDEVEEAKATRRRADDFATNAASVAHSSCASDGTIQHTHAPDIPRGQMGKPGTLQPLMFDLNIKTNHLQQCQGISDSVDGWENQKGDSLKMVNAVDDNNVSFLMALVDSPWEAGDAKAYKEALTVVLERPNVVGGVTDNPSVMLKAKQMFREDPKFAHLVMSNCAWHGVDLVAPVDLPSMKTAIKIAKLIVKFFKYRHRPKGVLRKKRETANAATRSSTPKGMVGGRLIPTLKMPGATRKLSNVNLLTSVSANAQLLLECVNDRRVHDYYKSLNAKGKLLFKRVEAAIRSSSMMNQIQAAGELLKLYAEGQRAVEADRATLSDAWYVMQKLRDVVEVTDKLVEAERHNAVKLIDEKLIGKVCSYEMALCVAVDPRLRFGKDHHDLIEKAHVGLCVRVNNLFKLKLITSKEKSEVRPKYYCFPLFQMC